MTQSIVVLNASYEPLHTVNIQHAIRMLARQVAVVEEAVDGRTFGPFPYPKVLRLVRYVYVKITSRNGAPRFSRTGVLLRDKYCCAYCGRKGNTVDHVLPRSKGGISSWMNLVTACRKCNEKKADRTPEEAGMKLQYAPFVPTFFDLAK